MPLERLDEVLFDAPAIARKVYGARAGKPKGPDGKTIKTAKPGISPVALQVLVALHEDPAQPVGDIAERLALDSSTVSHAIKTLEARKLVGKEPGGPHPRQKKRPLTAKGKRQAVALVAEAQRLLDEHAKPQG